jgi:hypothetical protein
LREERKEHERTCELFFDLLTSVPAFTSSFLAKEKHLQKRVLFGNALHCLAFSACHAGNDADASSDARRARLEVALGFYLAGATFLQALLEADLEHRELDVSEYLRRLIPARSRASADNDTFAEREVSRSDDLERVLARAANVD